MMSHLARLLATQPRNISYLGLKAHGLRLLGRNDEAMALVEELVAEHPHEEQVWVLYGGMLREMGEKAQAIDAFRKAIALRPGSPGAYVSLANLKTFQFSDEDLAAMQQQLALESVRGVERVQLEFALGAAYEYRNEFAASFEHYARGNSLHRSTLYYDPGFVTERGAAYADVVQCAVLCRTSRAGAASRPIRSSSSACPVPARRSWNRCSPVTRR